jgi:hypothetical protein
VKTIFGYLLFSISAVALYLALTQPIVSTRIASIPEIAEIFYPADTFLSENPESSQDDYDGMLTMISGMFDAMINASEGAKETYENLTSEKQINVFKSVDMLLDAEDYIPALLIAMFSIAVPIGKTLASLAMLFNSALRSSIIGSFNSIHKYTMLDVFVVSVTLFATSTQTILVVQPDVAVVLYLIYMISSFGLFYLLSKQERSDVSGAENLA